MSRVNVLIVSKAGRYPGFLEEIAAVDPRVSVKHGVRQFVAELREKGIKGEQVDRLEKQAGLVKGVEGDLDDLLGEAEVIFGGSLFPDNLASRSPNLKWVHILNVGIDRYRSMDFFDSNLIITNSRGCSSISIAEHVLAFMLMLAKDATRLVANKQKKQWERFTTLELRDRTVGLIGLGGIGTEIARLAKGFGMKVIATRRSAVRLETDVSGVDELYPVKDLHKILRNSDFIVIAAPLTTETRGMIGETELRVMKPTAYLVNIARGAIVDESALVRALKEGRIAGAGLDVFTTEPLSPESELWELPNVTLSSHMAAASGRLPQRMVELCCENLKRYLAGEEMINVIDREKSY
ncbi:D-2-hydroxyacid dehydrogenase [Chloroflexota bacterium]